MRVTYKQGDRIREQLDESIEWEIKVTDDALCEPNPDDPWLNPPN